ncbi:MAG: phosphotransferase, partial [Rickettsiales bacterium]|nr:phosphotransferase [Rickettsiales bacterium]
MKEPQSIFSSKPMINGGTDATGIAGYKENWKFKFINKRMFNNNIPLHIDMPVLRDSEGKEYIAYCPAKRYQVLGYYDMGRKWRVSKVIEKKTHKRYLLKNLKDENNFNECYAITKVQGVWFRDFRNEFVSVPKVIEAGFRPDGANYVIEEEKHGIHATRTILDSLSKREHADFCRRLAMFLACLHQDNNAQKFMADLPPKGANPTTSYKEDRYWTKLIYSYHSFSSVSLIHGDLAPRNVLIDETERKINVIDWGMARCDYAFAEFDIMYSDFYPFGSNHVDEIAREYCDIREREYNLRKDSENSQNQAQPKKNGCANPTMSYRRPKI